MKGTEVDKLELNKMLLKYGFDTVLVDMEEFIQHKGLRADGVSIISVIFLGENQNAAFYMEGPHIPGNCHFCFDAMNFDGVEDLDLLMQRCKHLRTLIKQRG